MKNVYVITNPELGWSCVIAVYNKSEVTVEDLLKAYPSDNYVIHEQSINTLEDLQNDIQERQEWDIPESF